jgi:hypothetical protein
MRHLFWIAAAACIAVACKERTNDRVEHSLSTVSLTPVGEGGGKLKATAQIYEDKAGHDKLRLMLSDAEPGRYSVYLGPRCADPAKARDLNAADEKGVGTATIDRDQTKLGSVNVGADGTVSTEMDLPDNRDVGVRSLIVRSEGQGEVGAMCGRILLPEDQAG